MWAGKPGSLRSVPSPPSLQARLFSSRTALWPPRFMPPRRAIHPWPGCGSPPHNARQRPSMAGGRAGIKVDGHKHSVTPPPPGPACPYRPHPTAFPIHVHSPGHPPPARVGSPLELIPGESAARRCRFLRSAPGSPRVVIEWCRCHHTIPPGTVPPGGHARPVATGIPPWTGVGTPPRPPHTP